MTYTRRSLLKSLTAVPLLASQNQTSTSIVMRITDRKLLHIENAEFAAEAVLPPASTIKPLALFALMETGKLHAQDEFACSRHLQLGGYSLNCIHPETGAPMNVARAIAYSCNGAVAHFASRFAVDELPQSLLRAGLASQTGFVSVPEATGRILRNTVGPSCELQALGEEGIAVTPLELLLAYVRLSRRLTDPAYGLVREGLEGAVEFGTGQAAKLQSVQVAGKTGSIVLNSGSPGAWFVGFAPSRLPRIAVVVFTPGHSGGGDAAPIAARLLERYL